MRFTVEKSELMDKLSAAMGSVSNKNTISSIEGVLFETNDDGTVRISTYDMNKGFRGVIPAVSVERSGSYIINAQRLFQTVRVLPDEDITFDVDDKCGCTLTSDHSSFSMFAMKGIEFPNLPELDSDRGFYIPSAVLKRLIGKVSHSIADQDNRPMLCGAFFEVSANEVKAVSCDGFTLSVCSEACEIETACGETGSQYSFIIPGTSLNEINKIVSEKEEEKIGFYLSRKHAILRWEDKLFFTRTIDSDYIDYKRLLPKDNDISVVTNRERFLGGLERANIVAEEKIQGSGKSYVKLEAKDQVISLTSVSTQGKVYDEMDCIHEGRNLAIGFNCRFLINSVRVAEGEDIVIEMKNANQAVIIRPREEDEKKKYMYMVLPVRMNEEE